MQTLRRLAQIAWKCLRAIWSLGKRFLSLARDRAAEHAFAVVVYIALALVAVMLYVAIPLLPFKLMAIAGVCVFASLLTTVRFRYGAVSEGTVSQLRQAKELLEQKLQSTEVHVASLEEKLKREKLSFYGMEWVWEIAIAEASSEFRKTIDYYIPNGSQDAIPWHNRPGSPNAGDKRASGSLTIPFKATMSVDLRQVRVDPSTNRFAVPDPHFSVRRSGDSRTDELRLTLQYTKPLLKDGFWVLCDEQEWQLPLWERETKQAFDSVLAAEIIKQQVGDAVRIEAEHRVASLLKLLTGRDATPVHLETLTEHKLLSAMWTETAANGANGAGDRRKGESQT